MRIMLDVYKHNKVFLIPEMAKSKEIRMSNIKMMKNIKVTM